MQTLANLPMVKAIVYTSQEISNSASEMNLTFIGKIHQSPIFPKT